ncbi:50S ribosomal protein L29 [Hyella patelloides LEGE 07179]|uniref:Large ribosomal subunit protein uL29 n=1 Tax=Hyella patelloides LEGE 07179 TaxID=945734 RepID=A0A563VYJ3_9CYAN|nr:50S ribosomal protein L29 [Hyella patelloides]VEP16447.1 50S ribosomal protein L29 [Hyella patelloides LEGE 07179]
MALPSIEDARKFSDEDLAAEILAVKRELFQLRLEQATRRLEKPHLFKHTKHRLSQLLTVERERQLNIALNIAPTTQDNSEQE